MMSGTLRQTKSLRYVISFNPHNSHVGKMVLVLIYK